MKRRKIRPKSWETVVEPTIERLQTWCDAAKGRRTQVAKALLLHPSQVTVWIARGGTPRLQKFCELIDFLDEQIPTNQQKQ
jgi:hypothetical protein